MPCLSSFREKFSLDSSHQKCGFPMFLKNILASLDEKPYTTMVRGRDHQHLDTSSTQGRGGDCQ